MGKMFKNLLWNCLASSGQTLFQWLCGWSLFEWSQIWAVKRYSVAFILNGAYLSQVSDTGSPEPLVFIGIRTLPVYLHTIVYHIPVNALNILVVIWEEMLVYWQYQMSCTRSYIGAHEVGIWCMPNIPYSYFSITL